MDNSSSAAPALELAAATVADSQPLTEAQSGPSAEPIPARAPAAIFELLPEHEIEPEPLRRHKLRHAIIRITLLPIQLLIAVACEMILRVSSRALRRRNLPRAGQRRSRWEPIPNHDAPHRRASRKW